MLDNVSRKQVGATKGWDHVTEEAVLAACRKFVGEILQVLPYYMCVCVCMCILYVYV